MKEQIIEGVSCDWGKSGTLNRSFKKRWYLFGPFPLTVLVSVLFAYNYIQIIHSGYHNLYFVTNLGLKSDWIKLKEKSEWSLSVSSFSFLPFFGPILLFCTFMLSFLFSAAFCLLWNTGYMFGDYCLENLLNTNRALHIVTDSVTALICSHCWWCNCKRAKSL